MRVVIDISEAPLFAAPTAKLQGHHIALLRRLIRSQGISLVMAQDAGYRTQGAAQALRLMEETDQILAEMQR